MAYLEPPPSYIKDWNWHWAQWLNKVYESIAWRGVLISPSANTTSLSTTANAYTPIVFDTITHDTYNMVSQDGGTGADDTIVTIPEGVQRVRYTLQTTWNIGTSSSGIAQMGVFINASQSSNRWTSTSNEERVGQAITHGYGWAAFAGNFSFQMSSGVVQVQAGDVISMGVRYTATTGSPTVFVYSENDTFFSLEIME